MDSRRNILFVDDEENVLFGLKRMLRGKREDWNMVFACGAHEALKILPDGDFDAIISDSKMPEVDGITLLKQVREDYPQMLRLKWRTCPAFLQPIMK